MGEYNLEGPMYIIPIGGVYVVLGIQWLRTLGTISTNYRELVMIFELEGIQYELKGLKYGPSEVINSHGMETLVKNGSKGVVFKLYYMEVNQEDENIPEELRCTLEWHYRVFQEIPKGLPPSRDHEHQIKLILGSTPPNKRSYIYPHQQKGKIEKILQDMLDSGCIQPSRSSFSAPLVMVRRKENSWRMSPDYRDINKITIKYKFPIQNSDELLDELHAVAYFKKLDLKSGYHQIRLRKYDIPKTNFRSHDGHYEFFVMPFGLTNVHSNFQSLMKNKNQPHLRNFCWFSFMIYLSIANHGKTILNTWIKS